MTYNWFDSVRSILAIKIFFINFFLLFSCNNSSFRRRGRSTRGRGRRRRKGTGRSEGKGKGRNDHGQDPDPETEDLGRF